MMTTQRLFVGTLMVVAGMMTGRPTAACTPVDATMSPPDAEGKVQVELRLPGQPWRGVLTARADEFCLLLPAGSRVTKVRTFFGTDRGDQVEAAVHVVVHGYQLVTRSEHKEVAGIYDAWRSEPVDYLVAAGQNDLHVLAKGWATAGRAANMEFGVIVELSPR